MVFKKPRLEDKEKFEYFYKKFNNMRCEFTFANTLLWSVHYNVDYTILDEMLVFKSNGKNPSFVIPIGDGDLRVVIQKLMDYSEENNFPFQMHLVSEEQFGIINEMFPSRFEIEYDRDSADYVYLSEDLMNLTGRKYHGKKNHINKFKQTNDWSYERITKENIPECLEMARIWRIQNGCDEDEAKAAEMCVTFNALKLYEELDLIGGLVRVDKKVVAFTIGEEVTKECFVVHIEKALAEVQGAYPMINQQSIVDYGKEYRYINREEDLGVEGLRKAKLSYKPVMLLEKGVLKLACETPTI